MDYLFGGAGGGSLKRCDPSLFAGLKSLVCGESRDLPAVEGSRLLGEAVFYGGKFTRETNPRRVTVEAAQEAVGSSTIIFLDPDNGLATDRMERQRHRSIEHVHLEELKSFIALGKTTVLYQCFLRGQTKPEQMHQQMGRWYRNLKARLSLNKALEPRILAFRPGNPRGFIVLPTAEDIPLVDRRLETLVSNDSPWREHFQRYQVSGI